MPVSEHPYTILIRTRLDLERYVMFVQVCVCVCVCVGRWVCGTCVCVLW